MLHDRYSLVVRIWRPVYTILSLIRKEWNISGSLIQAFVTFLVLSYVKILNISFDLLMPVYLQTSEGKHLKQLYLFNDGEVEYFGKEHQPYGILALIMLTVFGIFPFLLLVLYPCHCVQTCLRRTGFSSQALHTFMDAFQGCYRHHPKDCRYFASFYIFLRILQLLTFAITRDLFFLPLTGIYFIIYAGLVLFIKPYRKKFYKIDGAFFLFYACVYFAISTNISSYIFEPQISYNGHIAVLYVLGTFPIVYVTVLFLQKVLPKKIISKTKECYRWAFSKESHNGDSLPHRFEHQNEYSPLLK